jgi:hypothetical protein
MKSLEEIKKAINEIRNIDLNDHDAYSRIEHIINNHIVLIALPSRIFDPQLILHRCCINYDNNEFQTVERISFRTDLENITEFGRGNMPYQSIFYSADVRPTAILETSKVFRGENYKDIETFSLTTGHWESIQKLKFSLIIGSKNSQERNELIRKFHTDIIQLTKELFNDEYENVIEILNFI